MEVDLRLTNIRVRRVDGDDEEAACEYAVVAPGIDPFSFTIRMKKEGGLADSYDLIEGAALDTIGDLCDGLRAAKNVIVARYNKVR